MRALPLPLALLTLVLAMPAMVGAWGFAAHRYVAERMIPLLPAELRPLFEARKAFIVERVVDPDLWRNVGWDEEPPNHFVDLDAEPYGAYPFEALPREYDKAVEKFGREVVHREGTLPWRTAEFYGRLQREFAALKRPAPSPYVLDNIVLYAAVLTHYVSDGHVPLHAVRNYDGQLTGQPGAHGRFESDLFERYESSLRVVPTPRPPVTDARGEMFRILLESHRLAAPMLAADKAAAAGREYYDDGFYEAFRKTALPTVEQRVADSIAASAAFIAGAWEQAGKPAVPLTLSRPPRRVPAPAPPK
ncbi:MAG: hypothetical protein JNL48_11770 [Acidobacteria bacterium]|nr:hypothetical protein [Acidobacteriota bacterium]